MLRFLFYRLVDVFCRIGAKWDKLSVAKEDADKFAQANINPEPVEYMADLMHYTWECCLARYGESINWRFRDGKPDSGDQAIAEMLESHSTKVPLVLYRGVCQEVFDLMIENAKELKNVDLYEKGFMSTALAKGTEIASNYQLRIRVPAGAHVVYLGNVNNELDCYSEVVIQRGSKLRIRSIDSEYINCDLIV